jgi:hypothetical protein
VEGEAIDHKSTKLSPASGRWVYGLVSYGSLLRKWNPELCDGVGCQLALHSRCSMHSLFLRAGNVGKSNTSQSLHGSRMLDRRTQECHGSRAALSHLDGRRRPCHLRIARLAWSSSGAPPTSEDASLHGPCQQPIKHVDDQHGQLRRQGSPLSQAPKISNGGSGGCSISIEHYPSAFWTG